MKTSKEIEELLEVLQELVRKASGLHQEAMVLTVPHQGCCALRSQSGALVADGRRPIAHSLVNLCLPPKPNTVTITVPTEWAEQYADNPLKAQVFAMVQGQCREAVAPYQIPD